MVCFPQGTHILLITQCLGSSAAGQPFSYARRLMRAPLSRTRRLRPRTACRYPACWNGQLPHGHWPGEVCKPSYLYRPGECFRHLHGMISERTAVFTKTPSNPIPSPDKHAMVSPDQHRRSSAHRECGLAIPTGLRIGAALVCSDWCIRATRNLLAKGLSEAPAGKSQSPLSTAKASHTVRFQAASCLNMLKRSTRYTAM